MLGVPTASSVATIDRTFVLTAKLAEESYRKHVVRTKQET